MRSSSSSHKPPTFGLVPESEIGALVPGLVPGGLVPMPPKADLVAGLVPGLGAEASAVSIVGCVPSLVAVAIRSRAETVKKPEAWLGVCVGSIAESSRTHALRILPSRHP